MLRCKVCLGTKAWGAEIGDNPHHDDLLLGAALNADHDKRHHRNEIQPSPRRGCWIIRSPAPDECPALVRGVGTDPLVADVSASGQPSSYREYGSGDRFGTRTELAHPVEFGRQLLYAIIV
jgi:hypothetical protein